MDNGETTRWLPSSNSEPVPSRCRRCENGCVGSTDINDYCSFSKAVEHLGDRWSLPILAQLVLFGPRGFNDFASGLPGHISRSVLAEKLRKLEDLGLISRDGGGRRMHPYRLTAAGRDLAPTILSLRGWAEAWMPDDLAMVERDRDIVLGWLTKRIDVAGLPDRQAIVEIRMRHETSIDAGSCSNGTSSRMGASTTRCSTSPDTFTSREA